MRSTTRSRGRHGRGLGVPRGTIAGASAAAPSTFEIGRTFQAYTAKRGFPRYFNFVEGFPAVACADSDNPDRISDWVAAAGHISFDDYFRQIWTYASSPCLAFPTTGDGRYTGPFDAETANPVLVASTLYDPATPVHGALEVDTILPNSGSCSSTAGVTPRSESPAARHSSASATSSPRSCRHRRTS